MTSIWTPTGEWRVDDQDIARLDRHIKMYDDDLSVAQHPQTGDVCVFKETERFGTVPVCGWQRIPSIDEMMRKIYEIDTFRHGDEILKTVWKAAEKDKEALKAPADEAIGETAERLEFELRER